MFTHFTFKHLHWRRPTGPLPALSPGIERLFVTAPDGSLELLYAPPLPNPPTPPTSPAPTPLFFVHGGMHGGSHHPRFLRMVYATGMRELADDVLAALRWVQEREGGREAVLVGHSSGGAVVQWLMSEGEVRAKGLVLVAVTPGYGAERIAQSWRDLDPWFVSRMICHLWHPNSPLAEQIDEYAESFQDRACPYESFVWAVDLMKPDRGESVMVLCAELDRIMRLPIMEDLAETYRTTYSTMVRREQLQGADAEVSPLPGEGDGDSVGHGVRYCVVPRSGHQLQNDASWEIGARKLLAFCEQL
ncbi:Alpha/Beta hydrolase protein [Staphylotrichum tortipilum]|uniref:Alpha/Beta hydrolase protein n=1 Tax=Staphylotrichum tortipilum TaxID=2831512 RepID=A0AAN6MP20_9PEZI|nr:Alpha/Beta hydrolase protein [Staphylotrichum longicolle]